MIRSDAEILITSEHGGNNVPQAFAHCFASQGAKLALRSHRGFDPGSLEAARQIASHLRARVIESTTTRLLVDLNRSDHHPACFSRYTALLTQSEKLEVLRQFYQPYRSAVRTAIQTAITQGKCVIHLSIHTFTPRYAGTWRPIDVGLLFDPASRGEATFCSDWSDRLGKIAPKLRVLANEPYAGTDDGLTTAMRKLFDTGKYFGIEVEINHRFFKRTPDRQWSVVASLLNALPISDRDGGQQ